MFTKNNTTENKVKSTYGSPGHQRILLWGRERKAAIAFQLTINNLKLQYFTILIKAAACLIESEHAHQLMVSYGFQIAGSELANLKEQLSDRNTVVMEIKRAISAMNAEISEVNLKLSALTNSLEDLHLNPDFLKDECFVLIQLLHEIILKDYHDSKISDIIKILIENNLSPITITDADNDHENNNDDLHVVELQRLIRSRQRKTLHQKIFGQDATCYQPLPLNVLKNQRLSRIIYELTLSHAVIGDIQHHWTTLGNLKSIIRNKYFYSNKRLRNEKLFFTKNALTTGDVNNGDGNVICFCPYMVDFLAFYDQQEKKIKRDVVRISIDANHVDSYGKYNQFFKIYDFWSPRFNYMVHINDDLSINVSKNNEKCEVTIHLCGENKTMILCDGTKNSKSDIMFYGNLDGINRFCISTIFKMLRGSNDAEFERKFLLYLLSRDDNEIKKIIIILAQSITIFAEYNFNSSLRNSDRLIKTIHYVDKSLTLNLNSSSNEEYESQMEQISLNQLPSTKGAHITETLVSKIQDDLSLYGKSIHTSQRWVDLGVSDLRQQSPMLYGNGVYLETRPYQQNEHKKEHLQIKTGKFL